MSFLKFRAKILNKKEVAKALWYFCYINFAKVEYASGEYAESVWARSHLLVQFSLKKILF